MLYFKATKRKIYLNSYEGFLSIAQFSHFGLSGLRTSGSQGPAASSAAAGAVEFVGEPSPRKPLGLGGLMVFQGPFLGREP